MSDNERNINFLYVKDIFEKIKPKLIEVHGEEILKSIKVQECALIINSEFCNYEIIYNTVKEELREKFEIEIGNNPTSIILLKLRKKDTFE